MTPRTFYDLIVVPTMWVGFHACSPFVKKVSQGIRGRVGWKQALRNWADSQHGDKPIWLFHAASVGELEALRPIIDQLDQRGSVRVVVTVFSPSAYGTVRKIPGVELLTYLPFDLIENQRFLLDALRPALVAVSKHDIWPNLLVAAQERHIPTALVNANIHSGSMKIYPGSKWFNSWLFSMFDGIATVSESHTKRLQPFLDSHVMCETLGDSRYDRVAERVNTRSDHVAAKAELLKDRQVLVAGSTHPHEEQLLVSAVVELLPEFPDLFVIWVPHDPEPHELSGLEQHFQAHDLKTARWSNNKSFDGMSGVIVDVVGILAELYSLGDIALVGGGFDKGVHSVIEPSAAGLPVLFGPRYHISQEASYLLERGGGFVFRNRKELTTLLRSFLDSSDRLKLKTAACKAKSVVDENLGASERIINFLDNIISRHSEKKTSG
jgi:3-deoxy-D-manno-octulosonic-acid transferase